jgi:hypothetical protein
MTTETSPTLGVAFHGTWHTSVPSGLIFDKDLTPQAKVLWLVLRATVSRAGVPVHPTYDYLCEAAGLSRPTVSRSLKLLELAAYVRVTKQVNEEGWVLHSSYALFDVPQLPGPRNKTWEATVMQYVGQADTVGKLARIVAVRNGWLEDATGGKEILLLGSKEFLPPSSKEILPPRQNGSKEFLLPVKADEMGGKEFLPPRARRSSSNNNSTTTAQGARELALIWPAEILESTQKTFSSDLAMLGDDELAQAVLDECAAVMRTGGARIPTAYLRGCIVRAMAGQFVMTEAGDRIRKARQVTVAKPTVASAPAQELKFADWNQMMRSQFSESFNAEVIS